MNHDYSVNFEYTLTHLVITTVCFIAYHAVLEELVYNQ